MVTPRAIYAAFLGAGTLRLPSRLQRRPGGNAAIVTNCRGAETDPSTPRQLAIAVADAQEAFLGPAPAAASTSKGCATAKPVIPWLSRRKAFAKTDHIVNLYRSRNVNAENIKMEQFYI